MCSWAEIIAFADGVPRNSRSRGPAVGRGGNFLLALGIPAFADHGG